MARSAARSSRRAKPAAELAEEDRPFAHDEIVRGVEARRVRSLIDRGVLDKKQVYRVIPERTFNRRLDERQPLKPAEADAIARLLRITAVAEKAFGSSETARRFLNLPNPSLGNRIPYDLAETDPGAREVEAILSRIAYGDYT